MALANELQGHGMVAQLARQLGSRLTPCGTESELKKVISKAQIPLLFEPIILTGDLAIDTDITILNEAVIDSNGYSLALSGNINAGLYKIFTDTVSITAPQVQVLPQWFGAVADGVTDCASAIQASIDSATANNEIFFSPGTYLVRDEIDIKSNTIIRGVGMGAVIKSGMTQGSNLNLFNVEGAAVGTTTLTAAPATASRVLTIASTTGINANDYIWIVESDTWGMLHRVKSVDSSTQITLFEVIGFPWQIGDTVHYGDWATNTTIKDIKFLGTQLSNEKTTSRYEDHGVNIQKAHHVNVSNCFFENLGSRAVMMIDRASECIITENRIVQCYDRAIESHVKTSGNVIANNVIEGGLAGVGVHGIGTVCKGNTCKGVFGYDSSDNNRGWGIIGGDNHYCVIDGNTIVGALTAGISLGSGCYYTTINNNAISLAGENGIFVYGGHIKITNNMVVDCGTTLNDAAIYLYSTSNVLIENNYLKAPSSPATYAIASNAALTGLSLGNNRYEGFTTLFSLGASTFSGVYMGDGAPIKRVLVDHLSSWGPLSIADGDSATTTVGVAGAVVGDPVTVAFGLAIPGNATISGQVTAADTVTVTIFNNTGGVLNLSASTVLCHVWQNG